MSKISGFLPSKSGLHFSNLFPHMPLMDIDLGIGKIPIGDASNGICGGMVFTVCDYFEAGLASPLDATAPSGGPLYDYMVRRLFDSFNLPVGPTRYLYLMNPAVRDDETWLSRLGFVPHGRAWVMIMEEWPKIKADLDNGRLCALGLIKVKSTELLAIGQNHQVLAYGYELNGNDLTINIYDPNYPDNDDVTLSLNISDPWHVTPVTYSPPQPVYCFFRTGYDFSSPPVLQVEADNHNLVDLAVAP